MTTRTCTTDDGTEWTCAQAYAGLGDDLDVPDAAVDDDGEVTVVATPDGGEQTVRLKLPVNWYDEISDDDLVLAIVACRA